MRQSCCLRIRPCSPQSAGFTSKGGVIIRGLLNPVKRGDGEAGVGELGFRSLCLSRTACTRLASIEYMLALLLPTLDVAAVVTVVCLHALQELCLTVGPQKRRSRGVLCGR